MVECRRSLSILSNRDAPQPQPLLMNRSLPSTVLSPRLYSSPSSSSGGGGDYQHAVTAPPPPQILRREKVQSLAGANDRGNEKKKSLKEREEEYKRARERIFGSSSTPSSKSPSVEPQQRTQSPSLNGSSNSTNTKPGRNARPKS